MHKRNYKQIFLLILIMANHLYAGSWANETLLSMSDEEKIGQLFLIAAYVDPEFAKAEGGNPDIDDYIREYHVGGLCFVGPSEYQKQVLLTNHYQEISKYPILIAQDLEWGLAMRIKDGMCFPKNIALGTLSDNTMIYEMGKEIGRQARLIGVHMNLSPVLDVNKSEDNIAINVRSFGSSREQVAEKGVAMIQGLQAGGVIASAKHFPGLGAITVDPHLGLPKTDEVEIYPFEEAINKGVLSIQTEHVMALKLDSQNPASLSPGIVTELLKKELGFKGLVISGALRMKALTNHWSEEEIILKAFLAGSDMLLMPKDLPKARQVIKKSLAEGKIDRRELDLRVLKILEMKERVGLSEKRAVSIPSYEDLHSAKGLKEAIYHKVVTLVRDGNNLVPLQSNEVCYRELTPTSSFEKLPHSDQYKTVVLAVYPADPRRIATLRLTMSEEELSRFRVHGLSDSMLETIKALKPYQKKIIVAYYGNPFGLRFFEEYETLVMAYEDIPETKAAVANILH